MNTEIKKMLEYQKIESKLIKIEREIEANPNTEKKNKMKNVVMESQKLAENLEKEAKNSVDEFNKVKKEYEDNYKLAQNLNKVDLDKLSDEQLLKMNSELEGILTNLNNIEKRLGKLNSNVEQILAKFEKAKQNAFIAKNNYQSAKVELEKVSKTFLEEQEKLNAELKSLKPQINATLFKKYEDKRKDNIFPILVPLADNRCGACRMEQSKSTQAKLASAGFCECENCHRIIVADK